MYKSHLIMNYRPNQQSLTRAVPVSGVDPCHAVCTYQQSAGPRCQQQVIVATFLNSISTSKVWTNIYSNTRIYLTRMVK